MSLLAELDAEAARRPFSWIPRPGVELSPEGEERFALELGKSDGIADRLKAERAA